ncbi:TauD/TfdA family dioxygenase [Paraburkholderia sp. D1E]|uniref:TauD/TfdA family dioxygenase n=1 Tax=Paraburkholderia sp. D1E TaxID=3461398 RepID=UPI00404607ED
MNHTAVNPSNSETDIRSSAPIAGSHAGLNDEVTVQLHPQGMPLFILPVSKHLKSDFSAFHTWLIAHEDAIEKLLLEFGAVRLRGFPVKGSEQFRELMSHYPAATMGYKGGGGPRAAVAGRVMEATRTDKDRFIQLHQEMSYQRQWPLKLAFYSNVVPSGGGGATTIADIRRYEAKIPQRILDEVRKRGVLYRRNFRDGRVPTDGWTSQFLNMHRPWQEAFFTEDKAEVEAACEAGGMEWQWLEDGSLQTEAHKSGFVTHPVLGTRHWFNQISNQTALPQGDRLWHNTLTAEDLRQGKRYPNEPRFGDGGKIPVEDVELLRQIEDEVLIDEPYLPGEIMILDNVLCAHGRTPYEGQRDTLIQLLGTGSSQ